MKIHFYSFQNGKKMVSYLADAKEISPNTFEFIDKTYSNTNFIIKLISSKEIVINRIGEVNSQMTFILNNKTIANYTSKDLSFNFQILTTNIKVNSNSVSIDYDYYYDNILDSKIKIALLFKDYSLVN